MERKGIIHTMPTCDCNWRFCVFLAFSTKNGKISPNSPSINLDVDWIYRKIGRSLLANEESFGMDK